MIVILEPKINLSEDRQHFVFEACFKDPESQSVKNDAAALHIIDTISYDHVDYEAIYPESLREGDELIPASIGEKTGNPIKSMKILSPYDHPELEQDYPRGCLRIEYTDPLALKAALSSLQGLATFAKDDLNMLFD